MKGTKPSSLNASQHQGESWTSLARRLRQLDQDDQTDAVRAWLETRKPGDRGYASASRWLHNREHTLRLVAKLRPIIAKLYEAHYGNAGAQPARQ